MSPTATPTPSASELIPNPLNGATGSPFKPIYWYAWVPGLSQVLDEKYGIDVKIKTFNGFTAVVAGLFQEETFMAHVTMDAIVNAVNQGIDIVAPVGWVNHYVFPVIASPEIESWEDLQGKKLALHSPSSMSTMAGKTLAKEMLGPDHNVEFTFILGTPNRVAAIESGDVAAAAVSLAGAFSAQDRGIANILSFPWDVERLRGHAPNAWVLMRENWNERRESIGVVVEELITAYNRMYEVDPETVVEQAKASGEYGAFDVATRVNAHTTAVENNMYARDGGLQEERIEKAQDVMVETGIISEDERISRDDFVEDDFLP